MENTTTQVPQRVKPQKKDYPVSLGDASVYETQYTYFATPTAWLCSIGIFFFQEVLHRDLACAGAWKLVPPGVVDYVFEARSYADLLDMLGPNADAYTHADFIALPLNDSVTLAQNSSSHWALLVYERARNEFSYFDSVNGFIQKAKPVAQRFATLALSSESAFTDAPQMRIVKDAPKQTNSWDCGMYVCCVMQKLIEEWRETEKFSVAHSTRYAKDVTPEYVRVRRQEIAREIENLVAQKRK